MDHQPSFKNSSECLAKLARLCDILARAPVPDRENHQLEAHYRPLEPFLSATVPFLDEVCPNSGNSVGQKIACSLLDIAFQQISRSPSHSVHLLKSCLSFCVNEGIISSDEFVERASSVLYSLDWTQSWWADILDCFLLIPQLGCVEVLASKLKHLQTQVIGTVAHRVRRISKSNASAFQHFPQLPLTADYSRSQARLCAALLALLPKLLATRFPVPLPLLKMPWTNLLASVVEPRSRESLSDAEAVLVDICAWRALSSLAPVSSDDPRVSKAAVKVLQCGSDVVKIEVYGWINAHLSYHDVANAPDLLQSCLEVLRTLADEDSPHKDPPTMNHDLLEFLGCGPVDATTIVAASLQALRTIFERTAYAVDPDMCQATVSTLVDVVQSLTVRVSGRVVMLNWSPVLRGACEALCSVCFNLNDTTIPLCLILSVLQETKRSLTVSDASCVDRLLRDLNCFACVASGPSFKSASIGARENLP